MLAVLTDWVWGKGLMKPAGLAWRLEWLLVPAQTESAETPKPGGSTGRSRRLFGYACQSGAAISENSRIVGYVDAA
jgi:hypothetical protein